jgi:phosphatidylinositol-3-phosphatase
MNRIAVVVALVLAALAVSPAPAAVAAGSCVITTQTPPSQGSSATKVTWTWAVSCSGVTGYNVYTNAKDVTTGKSYGNLGTGSPYSTATAGATEVKTIPTCVPTDQWQSKVAVRSSSGALLAGPTTTTPAPICGAPPPPPPPPPPPGAIKHIVLVMLENHTLDQVTAGMPYLTGLGNTFAHATALKAITHPSLPNYFALTAGTTFGVGSDCGTNTSTCSQSGDNIFHQAGQAAGGWAGWAESMPTNCAHANKAPYVVHHAIAPFYTDLEDCGTNDIPFDPANPPAITAGFTMLTPNNNHNGHSTTLADADAWLQGVLPKLMADPSYVDGSTLLAVTFDEGVAGNQVVAAVFVNPALSGVTVSQPATHYSTLKLFEDLLGVPELGAAATAPDIRAALGL